MGGPDYVLRGNELSLSLVFPLLYFGDERHLLPSRNHAMACTPLIADIVGLDTGIEKRIGELKEIGFVNLPAITQGCDKAAFNQSYVRVNRHGETSRTVGSLSSRISTATS
jgi:hypothetical protein